MAEEVVGAKAARHSFSLDRVDAVSVRTCVFV